MRRSTILRIRAITAGILCVAFLLIGRLYYIQVAQGQVYEEQAEGQYVETRRDVYSRGSIFFTARDGTEVAAASVRSGYLLAFNPTLISDPAATCASLLPYLTISEVRCLEQATLLERTYVEVERTLPRETYESITARKLPGVYMYRNQWRFYPGDSLAARVIGFVGFTEKSDTELHGKYGLERQYDKTLFREQEIKTVNVFAEIFGDISEFVYSSEDAPAGDIVTTIEPTVARMLDSVLMKTQEQYQSELTGAIIMNPKTGAVYALSAVPTYNLNDRSSTTIEVYRNPLVENVYEFGSTIKALTVAAGLDSGAITPQSTYYDSGSVTLNGFTIKNYDGRARGTVPVQEILSQSLNTGVSHIVQQMGKQKFREYFLNLKIDSETGIDLPNEVHGLTNNLDSPRDVEYATASFGQGIALTPIAATRALAALGNGGYLVTPHLVRKIRYEDGTERDIQYPLGQQVFSTQTSEEISRLLTTVVDDALLGGTVALPNHTIAAKTGTAQIADPEQGGYYEDKFLHSFFGYFPAFDPEFLVFMYTVEPTGVRYASETLTLPFMEIAKFLINYYNLPPDR